MAIPERFSNLPEYAFPRLRALLSGIEPGLTPGTAPMVMTIGEPRHAMPDFVADAISTSIGGFAKYPVNEGTSGLLEAISGWIGACCN